STKTRWNLTMNAGNKCGSGTALALSLKVHTSFICISTVVPFFSCPKIHFVILQNFKKCERCFGRRLGNRRKKTQGTRHKAQGRFKVKGQRRKEKVQDERNIQHSIYNVQHSRKLRSTIEDL